MPPVLIIVAAFCCLLAAGGTVYFAMCIWAARRFQRERAPAADRMFTPPVSILKSLKGLDPHMYAAFRSHCLAGLSGIRSAVRGERSQRSGVIAGGEIARGISPKNLQIVHCPAVLGLNGKVSNLVQMLPHARFEHILINDSDIRRPTRLPVGVMAPFAKPDVGMVTTLYRGLAGKTLGLEAGGAWPQH